MIIRSQHDSLQFITQTDHAQLARRVMEHCVPLQTHPRAASILLAVGEHDNGWTEVDAAPRVDPNTGQPFDFVNAPADVRQEVWPRGVARLSADPWAAALVANHAITVYERHRADPAWAAFFPQMEGLRDDLRRTSGGRHEDLLADYRFVRLGDLISLVFCAGWSDEQRFSEWTVKGAGNEVLVAPDLFGRTTIPLEISAKVLPAGPFQSGGVLRERLQQAPVTVLHGNVRA